MLCELNGLSSDGRLRSTTGILLQRESVDDQALQRRARETFCSGDSQSLSNVADGAVARQCVTTLSGGRIRAVVLMSNASTTAYVDVLVPDQGVPAEEVAPYAQDTARRVAELCVRLT